MERVNARHLEPDAVPEPSDLITLDVSFISLRKIVPPVLGVLAPAGYLLPMIKPQFEAGRERVGKGGVIRSESVRADVIRECVDGLCELGLACSGTYDSPVAGARGNRESFALLRFEEAA